MLQICIGYNTDTLTIVDVTDKNNMFMLSRTTYDGAGYTHQVHIWTKGKILYSIQQLYFTNTKFTDTKFIFWF